MFFSIQISLRASRGVINKVKKYKSKNEQKCNKKKRSDLFNKFFLHQFVYACYRGRTYLYLYSYFYCNFMFQHTIHTLGCAVSMKE